MTQSESSIDTHLEVLRKITTNLGQDGWYQL
jgi:hypothetical protein